MKRHIQVYWWFPFQEFKQDPLKQKKMHHCFMFHLAGWEDDIQKFPHLFTPPKFDSTPPEKWWERKTILSYWVSVTFQGRTVKLQEGFVCYLVSWKIATIRISDDLFHVPLLGHCRQFLWRGGSLIGHLGWFAYFLGHVLFFSRFGGGEISTRIPS